MYFWWTTLDMELDLLEREKRFLIMRFNMRLLRLSFFRNTATSSSEIKGLGLGALFWGGLGHIIYRGEAKWENAELNKETLGAKLKQVQQHIHDWPSLYQRRNHTDEPISGESILGQLDGIVDIIGYYLSQLPYANYHNISNFNKEGGQSFD